MEGVILPVRMMGGNAIVEGADDDADEYDGHKSYGGGEVIIVIITSVSRDADDTEIDRNHRHKK